MRSKSKAIAGIALTLIMLASIMAGTTAVGATSEGPLSTDDCPICPESGMELSSSFRAWALVCEYRNSVDINYCGNIAIYPYRKVEDAQKRFENTRTSKESEDILRVDDDEIVVINRDSNYHYSVSGCFLRVCGEKGYITEVRVNTATKDKDKDIARMRFEALAKCAKRVVGKKCGEKDDEAIIKPDNTSCKDLYVDSKDFDLAYDNKMLRKEFLYFLYDYGSKHELKSASDKYAGWHPLDFINLGWFMFTDDLEKEKEKNSKFMTGKENELGRQINERFKKEGRPLKPAEVFEESLKINGNCLFDALLTSHNYLKKQCYDLRGTRRKEWKTSYNTTKDVIERLEAKLLSMGLIDEYGRLIAGMQRDEDAQAKLEKLDKFEKELEEMEELKKNAETTFKVLKQLRSETDNEGAWYHLFGTLTTGYAERENTWELFWSSAYTRIEVWGEHRFYKGIWRRKGLNIDNVEYCWDVWGGYLGGEIYGTLLDNQEKVKEQIKEHPEVWVKGEWDPSYILDAYTGQKIYE